MAIPVLILGESGTGKTASLRNCTPDAFGLINVSRKPLPFRSALKPFNTDDYARITSALAKATVPSLVIDDSQYLMVNAFMRRSKEKGYDTVYAYVPVELVDKVLEAHGGITDADFSNGMSETWEGYNANPDD